MQITQVNHIMSSDPAHVRLAHDARFEQGSAFANGAYVGLGEATVPLMDYGFRHADATYDVVSASRGFIFRLEDHLDRFERSCGLLQLRNPYDKRETARILETLVKLAGTREAYIFWCVTRGLSKPGGDHNDPAGYDNRFYAYVVPYRFIAGDAKRTTGLDLMVSRQYIRIPPKAVDPRAKNFHWLDLQMSLFEAHDHGKDFSVLCDSEGFLAEAPGSNIFLIKNGVLMTPDSGCLEGITRQTAMDLAAEIGIATAVERVHVEQLLGADEAFLTSTAGGIMPVNSVDGHVLGGEPGPGAVTTRLHNLYWEKRWAGWQGTAVDYAVAPDLTAGNR
jgi:branched-chain amino acid aminotransferase